MFFLVICFVFKSFRVIMTCSVPAGRRAVGAGRARGGARAAALRAGRAPAHGARAGRARAGTPGARAPRAAAARRPTARARSLSLHLLEYQHYYVDLCVINLHFMQAIY